jgi:hypothetical protein
MRASAQSPMVQPTRQDSRMRQLTPKQVMFVREYKRNGGNATAAHRLAYPNNLTDRQRASAASMLKKVAQVARALSEVDGAAQVVVRETADRYAVSQQALASMLIRLAAYDINDICTLETELDADGKPAQVLRVKDFSKMDPSARYAITEIGYDAKGRITVKMADKRQAAVNLAQLMGLITDRGASAIDPVTGKPVDRFQPVVLQIVRK